jgi:5-methylcytosine-specific restriction endonuclease McrA
MVSLSKKEINDIRGALRQCFHRSNYYKVFVNSKAFKVARYNKDGSRHKVDLKKYECASCARSFLKKDIQIDHIDPIGSFKSLDDISRFINRLYCSYDNLQVLCKSCHKTKTAQERKISRAFDKLKFY